MDKNNIRIVGVIDDSPFHYETWSGSSYHFFKALQNEEVLVEAISAKPPKYMEVMYKVLSIQNDIAMWRFKYHLNTGYYYQRTRIAKKKLSAIPSDAFNVILQIGAWYDLRNHGDKITVSYHDGNLHALLKSPLGYPHISNMVIERTLRHEASLYRKMDLIFPMSQWLARSFIHDFGVDPKKVYPVGAGINLPYILEHPKRSYETPRLLFVGKNFERKGGKYLLEAFKIARSKIKDITLTIIGPSLENLPLGVRCLDYVSKNSPEGIDRLLREYESATLFVMPSLYEPFGIVFAEAMAHRLPCIGSDICAIPEIIDHGSTGFVVPVRDSKALADRIITLARNPDLCASMGEKGYKKYVENFTWQMVIQKIIYRIQQYLNI